MFMLNLRLVSRGDFQFLLLKTLRCFDVIKIRFVLLCIEHVVLLMNSNHIAVSNCVNMALVL